MKENKDYQQGFIAGQIKATEKYVAFLENYMKEYNYYYEFTKAQVVKKIIDEVKEGKILYGTKI